MFILLLMDLTVVALNSEENFAVFLEDAIKLYYLLKLAKSLTMAS